LNVLLVVMPFAATERPALGVSVLKAVLADCGIDCRVAYLNLEFAEMLGPGDYDRIARALPTRCLAGEWAFAESMWGPRADLPRSYVNDVLRGLFEASDDDVQAVERARALAPRFLRDRLASLPWRDFDIIGFSSSTAQSLPSLALARLLKEARPDTPVVFGGANWQGEAGIALHRFVGVADYAISGEAELSFPKLLRWIAGDRRSPPGEIPGLVYATAGKTRATDEATPLTDLDSLPIPDFSDFYETRHRLPGVRCSLPSLTYEASRGCWWAKHGSCSFCGIDERRRLYRAKSPARVLEELRGLTALWPCSIVHLADAVVPPTFLDEVLPAIAADPLPAPLFFEVRPGLSRAQVGALAATRSQIQPGIESFSDHVLELLHKGTRGLENIRLLKWCRSAGVTAHWNLMLDVPGETAQDREELLELLPSISFLEPPLMCETIRVDRDSPYHRGPANRGIRALAPLAAYRYLFPFDEGRLAQIAYAFDHECDTDWAPPAATERVERAVHAWRDATFAGSLWRDGCEGGRIRLRDARPGAASQVIELDELESRLYEACEDIARWSELVGISDTFAPGKADDVARKIMESLVARRLVVRSGERFLSLALTREGRRARQRPFTPRRRRPR
jgi:ribosomal peptide maturation radical SAM protein 1